MASLACAAFAPKASAADTASSAKAPFRPIRATAVDGGELQFDGVVYSYRDADALKSISLWVPPNGVALRWPSGGDPWWHPSTAGAKPSPWGDLLIGPVHRSM
jgi:hypothetical protein